MPTAARRIQRIYLTLTLGNTLAASFIWGINTLFLLDAGLSNLEAFAANAFFSLGTLLFEIPTGVLADLRGRRTSYLIGLLTLSASTLLYLAMWQGAAPFWGWAFASALLGVGFTFFSGAVEAWLVDGMHANGYTGNMESVFAKGEIVRGIAMLTGSVTGGVIAQLANLGTPYIIRSGVLVLTFIFAFIYMKDVGFTPAKNKRPAKEIKSILDASMKYGLRNPAVRWVILTSPFTMGTMGYIFYALQPYLLELYGNPSAYSVAGLASAIVAGAQIAGGLLAPHFGKLFRRRTSALLAAIALNTLVLILAGLIANFWFVVLLVVAFGMIFSISMPIRQTYLNENIPSQQRATVLSFDSLFSSTGGVVSQPALGKAADMWSYPTSYLLSAGFQALALPFATLARKQRSPGDIISPGEKPVKTSPE